MGDSSTMADGVSLGKGAWDCDFDKEIPPEKEVSLSDTVNLLYCGFSDYVVSVPLSAPLTTEDRACFKGLS